MGVAVWCGEVQAEASVVFSSPAQVVYIMVTMLLLVVIVCLVKALHDV
jgi:hypothetical protein